MGRPEALRRKLELLGAQELEPHRFEWIVCLDALPAGADAARVAAHRRTRELLAAADPPFAFTPLEAQRPLGPGGARRACAARARGALLLFSDDDCLPPPDLLARHLAAQRARPGGWIGAIEFVSEAGREPWAPGRVDPWQLNGANCSLPAAAVAAAGGIPALPGYGGEDVLLGVRLARGGLRFYALPGAPVEHLGPDPRRGGDLAKARSAGANAARLARREPALAWRFGVHPALLALKRAALRGPVGRAVTGLAGRIGGAEARGRLAYERAYLGGALDERARPTPLEPTPAPPDDPGAIPLRAAPARDFADPADSTERGDR